MVVRQEKPLGEVLIELSKCTEKTAREIAASQELKEPLKNFDQQDFHVWVTAIDAECDYIVTTNHKRFPEQIGKIKTIHPSDFYNKILGI